MASTAGPTTVAHARPPRPPGGASDLKNRAGGRSSPVTTAGMFYSHIPGRPSFRSSAVNAVAIVPLLSSGRNGDGFGDVPSSGDAGDLPPMSPKHGSVSLTHSEKSFRALMESLGRFATHASSGSGGTAGAVMHMLSSQMDTVDLDDPPQQQKNGTPLLTNYEEEVLLVVPNSQLTRPGDWRYETTPLPSHDWSNGCQRLLFFDGSNGRMAHERLHNDSISTRWIDLIPSRGTVAVIGVLNVRDCPDTSTFHRAEAELQAWGHRYDKSGNGLGLIKRLFVFDSFDEESQRNVDLNSTRLGSNSIVAFPPSGNTQMMDMHLNVVINDMAVAVFCNLEARITATMDTNNTSATVGSSRLGFTATSVSSQTPKHRPIPPARKAGLNAPSTPKGNREAPNTSFTGLNKSPIGGIVNPALATAAPSTPPPAVKGSVKQSGVPHLPPRSPATDDGSTASDSKNPFSAAFGAASRVVAASLHASSEDSMGGTTSQLLTPLDELLDPSSLSGKDLDAMSRRDAGRREKLAADLSLLAGSPIDAYERYTRAAELTKASHDPLWYASSLEGCAAAFIAMAEAGGHGADEYLDTNFQLPEDVMTVALQVHADSGGMSGYGANDDDVSTNTDNVGRGRQAKVQVDRTKTTLPDAVYALSEESLGILGRHPKLTPLYTELLLKLGSYTAELEESHYRCRWGEGDGCYGGDVLGGEPRRWERTYVASLADLGDVVSRGDGRYSHSIKQSAAFDSVARCQRFSALLHRAVSAGALDPRTRADAAATAARICLAGVRASQWVKGGNGTPTDARLRLPRKAAFFTVVAAEAMSQCPGFEAGERAASLWLAAANIYSRKPNTYASAADVAAGVGGGASTPLSLPSHYAWGTLRASVLHALSQQVDHVTAEAATDLLLTLLSEISPEGRSDAFMRRRSNDRGVTEEEIISLLKRESDSVIVDDSFHGGGSDHGDSDGGGIATPSTRREKGRRGVRANLFSQAPQSAFFVAQSQWVDDDPIPHLSLPLSGEMPLPSALTSSAYVQAAADGFPVNDSLSNAVLGLNCVIPRIKYEACTLTQMRCIATLTELRQAMPTMSLPHGWGDFDDEEQGMERYGGPEAAPASFSIYGDGDPSLDAPPPLEVLSARIVKSESHMLLERTKAHGYAGKGGMASMATFFNPYAAKKKDEAGKATPTLVAEGEERTVVIEFRNRLSIPIDIPSCQLEFDGEGARVIEAPPLSFSVPAKTFSLVVHFPFMVTESQTPTPQGEEKKEEENDESGEATTAEPNIFTMVGVRVSCLNRSFFIPLKKELGREQTEEGTSAAPGDKEATLAAAFEEGHVPLSASIYKRSPHNKPVKRESQVSVRLESVPAQPHLVVSFTTSQTPLEDATTVPVHLSDGEIYTIPPFRLENDFGSSGKGEVERLQVLGVGLPGLPEEVLFDTDEIAAAREGEDPMMDDDDYDDMEDFEELMESDGLPPLKMKALAEGISLKSINDKSNKSGGNVVKFQIAATHDMGNQLANGGNVRIRFRYRGPSPNPATEIWRKREVSLRIVRVKGPRISSLTFRSDLSWGSAYSELCRSLARQRRRFEAVPKSLKRDVAYNRSSLSLDVQAMDTEPVPDPKAASRTDGNANEFPLTRVGVDAGVHVSGDTVVVLMAVANETNSTIVLSNRKGLVGGFEGSPMPTVRVTSGVSVKIPVVINRIDRRDEKSQVTDIAAELIARTALQWESEVAVGDDDTNKRVRQGRVRIPSRCLREIIEEQKSFVSRICKPPVAVRVTLAQQEPNKDVVLSPGDSVLTLVDVNFHDWVDPEVIEKCLVTLEFCCAPKDSGNAARNRAADDDDTAFIWSGRIRRTMSASQEGNLTHRARISFLKEGIFVVSACAKVSNVGVGGLSGRRTAMSALTASSAPEETWWAPIAQVVKVED